MTSPRPPAQPVRRALALGALALLAGLAGTPREAAAQAYPNRPITVIIPYAPGTGIDIAGRIITQKLSEDYGQAIVIRNMPGASGAIGADAAANSTPDGYTLAMVPNSIFINQFLKKDSKDPLSVFVPVAPGGTQPYLIAVPPNFAPKNLKEVAALAKSQPGTLNYTGLSGSVPHFMGVMFAAAADIDIRMVSYKSTTDAINDVLTGRVPLWITPLPSGLAFLNSSKVRGLALTGEKRSPLAPDVPTMRESGFPTMDIDSVLYFVAPRGTPAAIVSKLNADIARVAATKEIADKLLGQGLTVDKRNAQELLEVMRAEQTKWGTIVKASGLKPE